MPPRHGKSELISKYFPVWFLNWWPHLNVILASYEATFAAEWGRKARDIIEANPDKLMVRIRPDARAANNWVTNRGGGMRTAGVGGPITGRGANILIIDDPIKNSEEANSPVIREKLWDWYRSTVRTRVMPGGGIVIVQTRWHEDDLVGKIIADRGGSGWVRVTLPALAEAGDILKRPPGTALWPGMWPKIVLEGIRDDPGGAGEAWFRALFQQRPGAQDGSSFKRAWWDMGIDAPFAGLLSIGRRYDPDNMPLRNGIVARFLSFDTAAKTFDSSAYTAMTCGELTPDYRLVIREVWRERVDFPDLIDKITRFAELYNWDGKLNGVLIEDKSSGIGAIQTLRQSAPDWLRPMIIDFKPGTDKVTRANRAAQWCRAGCVILPIPTQSTTWLHTFEQELFSFPFGPFMDQVDSFDQLIIYLSNYLEVGWRGRKAREESLAKEAA